MANKKKGLFKKIIDKLDKKLENKAKSKKCCCCEGDKNKKC